MAWAVDQATLGAVVTETTYGDTSMGYTTSATVASNCWVFLNVCWVFSDTLTGVSGGGLTWNIAQARMDPARDPRGAVVYAWASTGLASSTAITLTWTGGDVANKQVHGWSATGGDASSFDAAITSASANSAALSLPYTTDTDGELIVSTAYHETGATCNTPTSPAVLDKQDSTTGANFYSFHREMATLGAGTIAGTWSFSGQWGAMGIRLNPAAGAPPDAPTLRVVRSGMMSR